MPTLPIVGHRLPKILAIVLLTLMFAGSRTVEAQYVVTETTDNGTGSTAGTLSNAILQANATGGTITFNLNGDATTLTLTGSMYGISGAAPITIDGGNITINAAGFQAFTVNSGNVEFKDLTIDGGKAQGQAGGNGNGGGGGGLGGGGAIYVDPNAGAVGIQNVNFTNNKTMGGAGGNGDGVSANGGNGGSYNGNAGPNTAPSGSGGGIGAVGAGDGTAGCYGGGGGGGSTGAITPAPGNGGGNGGLSGQGGNGGSAFGGAVFIGNGNTTTIRGGTVIAASNSAIGGAGGGGSSTNGTAGTGNGGGLYVGISANAIFDNSTTDITVNGNIFSDGFITIQGGGTGVVNFLAQTVISTATNPGANITVASGVLNGTTDGLAGPIVNNSIVRFTQAGMGAFNGQLSGTGSVEIEGGGTVIFDAMNTQTNLATNTFTYLGKTNVNNGVLFLGTTLANSSVNVGANGGLIGNGTIGGSLINSGFVAPGNGIGTLTVNQDFTANAGSTTQIAINDAGNTPGTNNSLLHVGGNVTLNGGNVAVQTTGGNYTAGTKYTFLTYDGSRTGTFASVTTNSAFLGAELVYDDLARSIEFMLTRNATDYASIAQTFNQYQVASYLDANSAGATGGLGTLLEGLNTLSPAAARYAFNQLSGEAYGTSVQVQFQSTSLQMRMLVQHVTSLGSTPFDNNVANTNLVNRIGDDDFIKVVCRSDCRPSSSYWATGYGLGGTAQGDGNASGLSFGQGGMLVGGDHWLDDATLGGLYGGYNYAQFNGSSLTQSVTANSGQFGGYLRRNFDLQQHVLVASGLGFDSYNSSRSVNVGGVGGTASGNYDGWQSVTYGEYGRAFDVGVGKLTPFAGLQYIYLRQNSFNETGAGPANLAVSGIDANSLRNLLGMRFDQQYRTQGGRLLTPQLRAAWLHEYLDANTLVSNRFVGTAGSSFAAQGLTLGRDWALLGVGVGWQITEQWSLTGNYDAQVNADQTFHAGSGNLQYLW